MFLNPHPKVVEQGIIAEDSSNYWMKTLSAPVHSLREMVGDKELSNNFKGM